MKLYDRRHPILGMALLGISLLGLKGSAQAAMEPTGGIALDQPVAQLGRPVQFAVVFSPPRLDSAYKGGVRIQVMCYQGAELVFEVADHYDRPMLLGGGMSRWVEKGGPATCKADLFYTSSHSGQKFNLLSSTSFEAAGL